MGINPRDFFWGGMGGKSLVVFPGRKVGGFLFFKKYIIWWCGMGWLEKEGGYIYIGDMLM